MLLAHWLNVQPKFSKSKAGFLMVPIPSKKPQGETEMEGKQEEEEASGDSDSPRLSSHALAALQEFLLEQRKLSHGGDVEDEEKEEEEEEIKMVSEDWRLSQFWYDELTVRIVAEEVQILTSELNSPVACVACPSLYVHLKKNFLQVNARLLEYDRRFQKYGSDFIFYDYNEPTNLPKEYHNAFQIVVADPPYLSEQCLEKTAETMKLLGKDKNVCFLLLTGSVQCRHAMKLLGCRPCCFRPSHQNKLGNEFMLYTNYDPLGRLGGWDENSA